MATRTYTDVPIADRPRRGLDRRDYGPGPEQDEYGRSYAGHVTQDSDAYGNRQIGDYDVYQSRGPARGYRKGVPGDLPGVGKDRDFLTSYGGANSPSVRGGIGGIDYDHDIADAPNLRTANRHHHRRARPTQIIERSVVDYDVPTTQYVREEVYSPQQTYTTTERSAYVTEPAYTTTERSAYVTEPAYDYEQYDEYSTEDFPTYTYGEATTTYAGATSALDYIDERRGKSGKRKWNPIVDMGETPTYWLIRCEIPGVRKDRLKVEVEGKDLVIKGKRVKELWNLDKLGAAPTTTTPSAATATGTTTTTTDPAAKQKFVPDPRMSGVSWLNKERGGKGTFKRRVRLPERVDNSAIQALYKDGILEVLVRKPEKQAIKQAKAQAKTVNIQHD